MSPSRLSKDKTFNNLYGTKGRRWLSWGVGRACVGATQEGLWAGSWAGGLGSPREVNVGLGTQRGVTRGPSGLRACAHVCACTGVCVRVYACV